MGKYILSVPSLLLNSTWSGPSITSLHKPSEHFAQEVHNTRRRRSRRENGKISWDVCVQQGATVNHSDRAMRQ